MSVGVYLADAMRSPSWELLYELFRREHRRDVNGRHRVESRMMHDPSHVAGDDTESGTTTLLPSISDKAVIFSLIMSHCGLYGAIPRYAYTYIVGVGCTLCSSTRVRGIRARGNVKLPSRGRPL